MIYDRGSQLFLAQNLKICFRRDFPRFVDIRAAGVVKVDGRGADVFAVVALGDCRVEFEAAVVVGEIEHAAGREAPHAALYEGDVVALYVEYALFFFGVGEGRRVAEDEVVRAVAFGKPMPSRLP